MIKLQSLLTKIHKNYSSLGDEFLFTPDSYITIFSSKKNKYNEVVKDDFIIRKVFGRISNEPIMVSKKKLLSDSITSINQIFDKSGKKDVLERVQKLNKLLKNDSVQYLTLSELILTAIKDSISFYEITHVRFHSSENQLKIKLFDYRKFINQDIKFGVVEYIDKQKTKDDFSFTINSDSFMSLHDSNYEINILDNGIIEFLSLDKNSFEYLFRNQDIVEPIIQFKHEKIKQDISLLLVSN